MENDKKYKEENEFRTKKFWKENEDYKETKEANIIEDYWGLQEEEDAAKKEQKKLLGKGL